MLRVMLCMPIMKKIKKVYKNGFNLIEAYPIRFPEIIETVEYDGAGESFEFQFPDKKVENLIITLCPTEPWSLPNPAIIKDGMREFAYKLEMVRNRRFPESHCHVVVNSQETNLIKELKQCKENTDKIHLNPPLISPSYLHVHTLDPIYPKDAPVLIVKEILGLDLAFGQDAIEVGVLILDPQTVIGIFEHYIQGNEFDTRLIPISGTGLKKNKILKVKPGTPIQKLLDGNIKKNIKYSVFVDGPLNGYEVKGLSQKIEWTTKNIVVLEKRDYKMPFPFIKVKEMLFTTNLMGELRRCVYCNYCDDICPVGLEPALFWHCYIRGENQKTRLYALDRCIECGLCSFICPSKLELLQVIKECKLGSPRRATFISPLERGD